MYLLPANSIVQDIFTLQFFFLSLGRVGKLCIFPTTQTLNMTFLMNYEKRPLAHSGAIEQKEVEKKSRHFIGKSIISRSLPFYDNYDWYANPFSAISFSSFYFSIELALEWQKHQTMVFCEGGSQQSVKISNRAYIVILFPFFALLLWNKLKSTYFLFLLCIFITKLLSGLGQVKPFQFWWWILKAGQSLSLQIRKSRKLLCCVVLL